MQHNPFARIIVPSGGHGSSSALGTAAVQSGGDGSSSAVRTVGPHPDFDSAIIRAINGHSLQHIINEKFVLEKAAAVAEGEAGLFEGLSEIIVGLFVDLPLNQVTPGFSITRLLLVAREILLYRVPDELLNDPYNRKVNRSVHGCLRVVIQCFHELKPQLQLRKDGKGLVASREIELFNKWKHMFESGTLKEVANIISVQSLQEAVKNMDVNPEKFVNILTEYPHIYRELSKEDTLEHLFQSPGALKDKNVPVLRKMLRKKIKKKQVHNVEEIKDSDVNPPPPSVQEISDVNPPQSMQEISDVNVNPPPPSMQEISDVNPPQSMQEISDVNVNPPQEISDVNPSQSVQEASNLNRYSISNVWN